MGERTPRCGTPCFKLMLYVCCVGFASLDVVCDEPYDCAWSVGLYQLSDLCAYVYSVESFAHIECYSDRSRRGRHLVERCYYFMCLVLCFVPVLRGCAWYFCCYVRKKVLLQCLSNYREEGYGPVWGAFVYDFVRFWDGDYVIQLPYVLYYVVVKSSFKHACEECETKMAKVF